MAQKHPGGMLRRARERVLMAPDTRANLIGFGLMVGAVFAIGALAFWIGAPRGAPVEVDGVVVGFGLEETEIGSLPLARVQVEGRLATVRLPRGVACAKGDRMHLLKSRGGLGARYEVASRVCSRPPEA